MLWAFLVVALVSWFIASLIAGEQGNESVSPTATGLAALRKAGRIASLVGGKAREAWHRRAVERSRPSVAVRFSSRDSDLAPIAEIERVRWRHRLVAVMELILFVVLLSALFAGALAAAALKFGHLHS